MIKILILIGLLIIAALQACDFNMEGEEVISPAKFTAETKLENDYLRTHINQSLPLNVLANDAKLPNSTLVFSEPENGTIQIDSMAGGFLYVPAKDFKGKEIFKYRVCGAGPCEYATVEIMVF
ncbi:Ig-like domain-containing protein [Adhaeribacter terreus]|uniref:Ig-like domain-containing protein n=1 Tax=Adhaeribacter terreus TaxID=529703 RepID=A0ABW0E8I9_9BACT